MRILLITDNHTLTGGAERYFFDLKAHLKNRPETEVYSLGFGSKEISGDDFYILKKPAGKFFKLIWQVVFHPLIFLKLRKKIKHIQPDIIHIHNIKHYTASLLAAIKPYPVVQTVHDYSLICPAAQNIHQDKQPCLTGMRAACFWKHHVKYPAIIYLALAFVFYKLKKQIKKTVSHFFAPSPLLADYLTKNNFHDTSYVPPFKPEIKNEAFDKIQPYHFLFAGNLGKHKGVDILLNEFSIALQTNPNLTLSLAGSGNEENNLKKQIKKLKLEKQVFLRGWQTSLEEEYQKCAAVIFPSIGFEAFGLVITEAMSYARPIIASDRSTAPWLIDNEKTGLIFNPLIKGNLAEKIIKIAGNQRLVHELGSNGRDKLAAFMDNDEMVKQLIEIYEAVVSSKTKVLPA